MRQIKFKAKRLDGKGWIEGTPICINGKPYSIMIGEKESPDIDPFTICQFTGLKDCKGNEIWEGDILEGYPKCEIVFSKGTFATRFIDYDGEECVDPLYYFIKEDGTVECKVIGNKFDKEK
nr:MAG TPA: YopX protein [Caudoviricetes sp.]